MEWTLVAAGAAEEKRREKWVTEQDRGYHPLSAREEAAEIYKCFSNKSLYCSKFSLP